MGGWGVVAPAAADCLRGGCGLGGRLRGGCLLVADAAVGADGWLARRRLVRRPVPRLGLPPCLHSAPQQRAVPAGAASPSCEKKAACGA